MPFLTSDAEPGVEELVHTKVSSVGYMSRDQNPLVGNPLASGNKDLAVSKRVGFVSYRKQNRSACCAVRRRKLLFGAPHVAPVSAVSVCQEKRAP